MRLRLPSLALATLLAGAASGSAAAVEDGKALLEHNCSRCHAVMAGAESPLKQAPNLWIVLGSYPVDRLEVELGEGIAPRHPNMPQVQFTDGEIANIYHYLHGKGPDSEYRRPQ